MNSRRRGIFVTVEGLDFCGKSTLVDHLKRLLSERPVHFSREPGGTPAAEMIRGMLLDPELEMNALTEAYLYAAARADHVRREIWPCLQRGEWVVCERFLDSSLAYQGCGREIGMEAVRDLNRQAVGSLLPDRTFYLRLDTSERERRARESGKLDRLENAGAGFMHRVEEGFEELTRLDPERIVALDATAPPEELAGRVEKEILELADL